MSFIGFLAAGLLTTLAGELPIHQPTLEEYAPEGGGFSVRFPGKPKESTQSPKSELGEVTVHTATFATSDGNVYMVSYTDLPAAAVKPDAVKTLFEGVREGVRAQYETVKEDKEINFSVGGMKVPAHELLLANDKSKQQARLRVMIVGNRMYQIGLIGAASFVDKDKNATAFLNSFKVTK